MKNYLEHDIKVKYIDGTLSFEKNWQWFIDIIERDFSVDLDNVIDANTFKEKFQVIKDVYSYLIKINRIDNSVYTIQKDWLKELNLISLMYIEKLNISDIWENLSNDFYKLFALIVYTTILLNKKNNTEFLYDMRIFTQKNIFELLNITSLIDNRSTILNLLKKIKLIDIKKIKRVFVNNINQKHIPLSKQIITKYKKKLLSHDCFNFNRIILNDYLSWQEYYLFDMLQIKIEDGNRIIPISTLGGTSYPDTSLWTIPIINNMLLYFKNTDVIFIIENIDYLLNKNKPSISTQEKHFELVIKHLKKLKIKSSWMQINCSSLQLLSNFLHENIIDNNVKKIYMKDFSKYIQKFKLIDTINNLKEMNLPISTIQKNLLNRNNSKLAKNIFTLNNEVEFYDYCSNNYTPQGLTDKQLDEFIKKFNYFIKTTNSVSIAYLFFLTIKFLIKAKNNESLNRKKLNSLIIQTKELWKNKYYKICIDNMQVHTGSFTISNEENDKFNNECLNNPLLLIKNCIPENNENILNNMIESSKNPLHLICQNILITHNCPIIPDVENYGKDGNIEKYLLELINKIINKKGYKLLNVFSSNTYLYDLYNSYKNNIIFNISIFHKWDELYIRIKEKLKDEYQMIDIINDKIYLAHVTQLFPIVENKIRELGMLYNIIPFVENDNDFNTLKEPTSILIKIFDEVYTETNDLFPVCDLLFIYMSLYDKNFLNIRNECIHGNYYVSGNDIETAFRITLLCLELVCQRISHIKDNYLI